MLSGSKRAGKAHFSGWQQDCGEQLQPPGPGAVPLEGSNVEGLRKRETPRHKENHECLMLWDWRTGWKELQHRLLQKSEIRNWQKIHRDQGRNR